MSDHIERMATNEVPVRETLVAGALIACIVGLAAATANADDGWVSVASAMAERSELHAEGTVEATRYRFVMPSEGLASLDQAIPTDEHATQPAIEAATGWLHAHMPT